MSFFAAVALAVGVVLVLSGAAFLAYGVHRWGAPGPMQAMVVGIPYGASATEAVAILREAGVIRSAFERQAFLRGLDLTGRSRQVQAGTYRLPAWVSLEQTADIVTGHFGLVQHWSRPPEGLTPRTIVSQAWAASRCRPVVPRNFRQAVGRWRRQRVLGFWNGYARAVLYPGMSLPVTDDRYGRP